MPKENLKDKLDGNELDLSLNNLTTLPVKELAAIPRATNLDLSCNLLDVLPDTFCTLTHLVKIDLSKNRLTSLPDDFGNLRKLQHLDLLGNKLEILPVSMYQMTKLKWLDLKDNPLEKEIKQSAGDCLDEKQCKKCAENIVSYMKMWHGRLEKRRQKEIEEEKKSAAMREAQEEEERQRLQDERKKRKQEKKQAQKVKKQASPEKPEKASGAKAPAGKAKSTAQKTDGRSSITQFCLSFFFWIFLTLGLVLLAFTGLLVFCQNDPKHNVCEVVQYEVTIVPFMKNHIVPHIESNQKRAQQLAFGKPIILNQPKNEGKNKRILNLKAEDLEKLIAKAGGSTKGVKIKFGMIKDGKQKAKYDLPEAESIQEPTRSAEEIANLTAKKRDKRLTCGAPELMDNDKHGPSIKHTPNSQSTQDEGACKICTPKKEKKKSCQAKSNSKRKTKPDQKTNPMVRKPYTRSSGHPTSIPMRFRKGSKFHPRMKMSSKAAKNKNKKIKKSDFYKIGGKLVPKPWTLQGRLEKGKANRKAMREGKKGAKNSASSKRKCSKRK